MWMQNTPLHYVVNLFFWRFAVIFLQDFISNCVYTAVFESHCIFILIGITAQSKLMVFCLWHWILGRKWVLPSFFLKVFAAQSLFCSFLAALLAQYRPEVSDETGALLVYSSFITYKSFSHRPTSIEHAKLLGMWTTVNPECMFFKNFRGKLFENVKRYAKSETTIQKTLEETIPNHILHVQFECKRSVSQSNLLYP